MIGNVVVNAPIGLDRFKYEFKILPALTTGAFMHAFRSKPPLDAMLAAMPVNVILNADAGLLGAAVFAAEHR